jgi:hypothetical protein
MHYTIFQKYGYDSSFFPPSPQTYSLSKKAIDQILYQGLDYSDEIVVRPEGINRPDSGNTTMYSDTPGGGLCWSTIWAPGMDRDGIIRRPMQ